MSRPSPSPRKPKKTAELTVGEVIRSLRLKQDMPARELAERVGVDPRLINAIEKRRIVNPSLNRLADIARALGLSLSQLLAKYESQKPDSYSAAAATGEFVMDFSHKGFKLISYTLPIREMFCGKMILGGEKKLDQTMFPLPVLIFVQVIIGKIIVTYLGDEKLLREGQALVLNGHYDFGFANPTRREVSFLLFTTPAPWGQSFLQQA